jgi:hypothetical protein
MEKRHVSKERIPAVVYPIRTLALAVLFFALQFNSFSQSQKTSSVEKFVFVNLANSTQESFFRQSIDAAKMEAYRLKGKRVTLHFENGFDIEMLSAQELYARDNSVLVGNYAEEFPKGYQLPVFRILESGQLIAFYSKPEKIQKQ